MRFLPRIRRFDERSPALGIENAYFRAIPASNRYNPDMKHFIVASVLLGVGMCLQAAETRIGEHVFAHPDGFEVELVAGPPLVDRPIVADFDEAGNLYVADSAGVNDKVEKQLEEKPHRIVRLSDTDGDGVYDKSVVFADKMMFPEGLLWYDGAVYCGAPPSIWKLEDTDNDGVADRRTEWFNVGTLTGCANDLHGPYAGPAGWIYWTKGAFAKLDLELGDGSRLTDCAAHLFRARPDGSGLESYAAGGMDNPVDIAFGERGDAFLTSTFLVHPGNGQRDGVIHSIYGSVYPKRHGVIDPLPRTGELMPAMTHLGPAAPCGLCTYRSEVFGPGYRGDLFSCLFNMRKVVRHHLTPDGATFRSEDSDFLVSDQVDFHPTDVREDVDGSLLVLDTGGWYKLCCPTSVIAKPEVFGGIYRVRRKDVTGPADPRGLQVAWNKVSPEKIVSLLSDPRPAVRDRAVATLAERGESVLPHLQKALGQSENRRKALGALWALARIRTAEGRATARKALDSIFTDVQQAGAYVCGLERDPESFAGLMALLDSKDPAVRREAATALGRLKNPEACGRLLVCAGGGANRDRFLEHALIFALIEIDDPAAVRHGLRSASGTRERFRALWALDQMKNGGLAPAEVIREGISAEVLPLLKKHPEWDQALAEHYGKSIGSEISGDAWQASHILEFIRWPAVAGVVGDQLLQGNLAGEIQTLIAETLGGGTLPDALLPGVEKAVTDGTMPIRAWRGLKPDQLTEGMEQWLRRLSGESQDRGRRLVAMEVLARCGRTLSPESFEELLGMIGASSTEFDVARALTQARLTDVQKRAVANVLPKAGLVELQVLLTIFNKSGSADLGKRLAEAMAESPYISSVPAETIHKLASAFPESVRETIVNARPADPERAETEARVNELESSLPKGDRSRGHQVFKSAEAACATCHRIAYVGGAVGPDLTRIGAIRSRRDLLESIIVPSASYARGYEPMILTTNSGESAMGVLSHRGDSMILTDVLGNEKTFPSLQVKDVKLAPLSLMPSGIDQNLDRQELADLLAFLEGLR